MKRDLLAEVFTKNEFDKACAPPLTRKRFTEMWKQLGERIFPRKGKKPRHFTCPKCFNKGKVSHMSPLFDDWFSSLCVECRRDLSNAANEELAQFFSEFP